MKPLNLGNRLFIFYFFFSFGCGKPLKTNENKVSLFFNQGFLFYENNSIEKIKVNQFVKKTDSKCTDHYITEFNFNDLKYFIDNGLKGFCYIKQTVPGCNPFSVQDLNSTTENSENLFSEIQHIKDLIKYEFSNFKIQKISIQKVTVNNSKTLNSLYIVNDQNSIIYRSVYYTSWQNNSIEISFNLTGKINSETELFEMKFMENLKFKNL
jgi:hypothetical protein